MVAVTVNFAKAAGKLIIANWTQPSGNGMITKSNKVQIIQNNEGLN